jgi:putative DNA primase/helicase
LASPIGAFLRERCAIGGAYSAKVSDMFEAWINWCAAQGRDHPGTVQSFGRDLSAAVPGMRVVRPRGGDDRYRCYQGVRLKAF